MIISDPYTKTVDVAVYDAFFGGKLRYVPGATLAVHRVIDARAEIAAVNEAMKLWQWVVPIVYLRYNGCHEPCDNWNGPCVCGAWHKDGV